MTQQKKLLFLYCEENLHVGAGSATGTIDLPIQRESHTGFPKMEGSSLRGAIRESINDIINSADKPKFESVFGKRDSGDQQSAIDFPDAKLLLFPVRSYKGIFAWITCPLVLNRFKKDINNWFGKDLGFTVSDIKNNEIIIQSNSTIGVNNAEVVLEEFLFKIKKNDIEPPTNVSTPTITTIELGKWIASLLGNSHEIINALNNKLAIVSDEVYKDFVKLYSVKMTRNRINPDTGTADGGALFNEEFLPSESILYSFALASDEFKTGGINATQVMEFFTDNLPKLLRVGGDKGIGKGLIRQNLVQL